MEGHKKRSSSNSFTAELFGPKDSPATTPSTGIFASVFPPPSTVVGRNSSSSKQSSGDETWNLKQGKTGTTVEDGNCSIYNKGRSSAFHERRMEPCHLSSSLYYGGQDVYSQSPTNQTTGLNTNFKKDSGEDDTYGSNSAGASRGNWWQGSLYY